MEVETDIPYSEPFIHGSDHSASPASPCPLNVFAPLFDAWRFLTQIIVNHCVRLSVYVPLGNLRDDPQ